jgi:hypothetical protein
MKKRLTLVIVGIMSLLTTFSQESAKQIYEAPNLKEEIAKHKVVAILPFKVTISYKRLPKGHSFEGNQAEEKNQSVNMQQGMYTYLLRKAKSYYVLFQDVDRTNALLKRDSLFNKIDEILPDSLCKLLQVDAVIKCSYAYEKTGSEVGAIAKTLVFGVGGKTASGSLTMQIYESLKGTLLWRFYKEMNETVFSNANEVMERMMRKVSRNFPYEK